MTRATIFDLASLTKVTATTTAVAVLFQEGHLTLDSRIADLLNDDAFQGPNGAKAGITVKHCLTHTAGFPPDPNPWYWNTTAFGCPSNSGGGAPPPLDFTCLPAVYDSLMAQTLEAPPGQTYVYSDLSFISLQFAVGAVVLDRGLLPPGPESLCEACAAAAAKTNHNRAVMDIEPVARGVQLSCAFEAFVRNAVLQPSGMQYSAGYLPPPFLWPRTAPTLNDTEYTMRTPIQGEVSDGDAFAMGGIAGHAGLFATLGDVAAFAVGILNAARGQAGNGTFPLNSTTAALFTAVVDSSLSSRALGWDTNSLTVNDFGFDGVCGSGLTESAFLHIGYSGTCICIDPVRDFWSVVLTNRVFNCQGQLCPAGSEDAVKEVYRNFNTAAAAAAQQRMLKWDGEMAHSQNGS